MGSSEKQHTQLLQVWRWNRVWLQRLYLSEQGWDYSKYNFIIAIIHVLRCYIFVGGESKREVW